MGARGAAPRPEVTAHDLANLALLPALGTLVLAGLAGAADLLLVTRAFFLYILLDLCWIAAVPRAVPSLPGAILAHHAVTLALLAFPLREPAKFGVYTCLDGLVEVNTFFLIARRQSPVRVRAPLTWLYWATFVPLRLGLYPALVPRFWAATSGHPLWERLTVVAAQLLLVAFNFVLFGLSVAGWRKRAAAARAPAGAPRRAAPRTGKSPAKGGAALS
jgi:hypothetical protein